MALQGNTTIELHNVKTGETKIIEKHNLITKAAEKALAYLSLFSVTGANSSALLPLRTVFTSGIVCYPEKLTDESNRIYPPQGLYPTCYANQTAHTSSDLKRGNPNVNLSISDADTYTFVYDWGLEQGNGVISSIGLTTSDGALYGFGNESSSIPILNVANSVSDNGGSSTSAPANNNDVILAKICGGIDPNGYLWSAYPSERTVLDIYKIGVTSYSYMNDKWTLNSAAMSIPYKKTQLVMNANSLLFSSTTSISSRFFDIGEYLLGIANASANTSGNATVYWSKIKKSDFSFEEGTWTLPNVFLHKIASVKITPKTAYNSSANQYSEVWACYENGYLYIVNASANGIYKLNINDTSDIKLISLPNTVTVTNEYNAGMNNVLKPYAGRIYYESGYLDGDDPVITAKRALNCTSWMNVNRIFDSPLLLSISQGNNSSTSASGNYWRKGFRFYLAGPVLFTVNNLEEPIEKTSDMTMRITYKIGEFKRKYVVKFFDIDRNLVSTLNVEQGDVILKSPVKGCFKNGDSEITFPFTPTSDVSLYEYIPDYVYIVNPNGYDMLTTYLNSDATGLSFTGTTSGTGDYTAMPSNANSSKINYHPNVWKIALKAGNTAANTYFRTNQLIDPVRFTKLIIKYLYVYNGESRPGLGVALTTTTSVGTNGWPASSLYSFTIGDSSKTETAAYYRGLYGSTWSESAACINLDDPAWREKEIDITGFEPFYLWFQHKGAASYIAEIRLEK